MVFFPTLDDKLLQKEALSSLLGISLSTFYAVLQVVQLKYTCIIWILILSNFRGMLREPWKLMPTLTRL